jgi:hypothetical protein
MATFWIEGDKIMNQDKFLEELSKDTDITDSRDIGKPKKNGINNVVTEALHIPHGDINRKRINNICDADLLIHLQQYLIPTGRCIIDMITSSHHECIKTTDDIRRSVRQYASSRITKELYNEYPQYCDESADDYIDRLCHIIMHKHNPWKSEMMYCGECIRKWLNSHEW